MNGELVFIKTYLVAQAVERNTGRKLTLRFEVEAEEGALPVALIESAIGGHINAAKMMQPVDTEIVSFTSKALSDAFYDRASLGAEQQNMNEVAEHLREAGCFESVDLRPIVKH